MKEQSPKPRVQPPKLANRFLGWFIKGELLEEILGDLYEYHEELQDKPNWKRKLYYWFHVFHFLRPFAIKNFKKTQKLNYYGMYKNYFKIGLRNIFKYKTFSFINIFGLAVAMAVSLVIILMLVDQHDYDQFNVNKDKIYRVHSKVENSGIANASSPFPLSVTMVEDYPMVEKATRLLPGIGGDAIHSNGNYAEVRGFFADEQFFELFSFELKEGDKSTALKYPNSMIISSEVAYKLFNDKSAIGQTIQFSDRGLGLMKIDIGTGKEEKAVDWGTFTITGVIELEKYKSHIKFDMLTSSSTLPRLYEEKKVENLRNSWDNYSVCYTYLMTREGTSAYDLHVALNEMAESKYKNNERLAGLQLLSRNLNDITPGQFVGNPITLRLPIEAYYVLIILAMIIMISACLNYTNLSIARALTRSKEIGVRKVIGAKRRHLVFQFLMESVIVAICSLVMANVLLFVIKPALNGLWLSDILSFDLTANLLVYAGFLVFSLVVGVIAGIYPALVLSGFTPLKALKKVNDEKPGKIGFRKILSTSQFAFSLFFIVSSILVVRQFNHIMDFEYGFDKENVLNIPIQGNDYKMLQQEFASIPGVVGISACEFIPALLHQNGSSVSRKVNDENSFNAEYIRVDSEFVDNLGLSLIAGVNLTDGITTENRVLVNEITIKTLGFENIQNAIGVPIYLEGGNDALLIAGVIENFKFQNPIMGDGSKPLILRNQPELFSFVNVKFSGKNASNVLSELESKWAEIDAIHPFKYYMYDQQLSKSTRWFGDLVAVIGFIAFLAIVITCLGLLGMAIYLTERRTKEVGIRKVLGASGAQLTVLLGKSFLKILIAAIVISAPLSYLVNNLWLENFPNRVDFGIGTILIGSLILLTLGMLTISFQLISVSNRNPTESLKNE